MIFPHLASKYFFCESILDGRNKQRKALFYRLLSEKELELKIWIALADLSNSIPDRSTKYCLLKTLRCISVFMKACGSKLAQGKDWSQFPGPCSSTPR